MNQRLKRWESPRQEGRNDKGKGGSARQRQKRKQFQMLRKKLNSQTKRDGDRHLFLFKCSCRNQKKHCKIETSSTE